jgi:diguanylate cyclase (GGDEF)-like protein
LLRATGVRLGCAAVALLTSSGAVRRIWARSASARSFASEQIDALSAVIVERTVDQRSRVLSNKVRITKSGPVVGKVIAVPVATNSQRPVGILIAIQRPKDAEFDAASLRILRGLADTLSNRMLRERDPVTGLMTWSGFTRRVERIGAALRPQDPLTVLYGNIDRLHILNNAHGMAGGDQAIVHAAHVIRRCLATFRSVACRLSGDRFVVALPLQNSDTARGVADKIRAAFESEMKRVFGDSGNVSISWGIVSRNGGSLDVEQAITDAELACRAAKDRGRARVEAFEPTDASMIRRHDDIDAVRLLRNALGTDRLLIYAQPIVPLLNTALPTAYEFLARIDDGKGKVVEPAGFMSAAARYQMLPELDRAVVERAFRQLRDAVPGDQRLPFSFSINVCGPTISAPGFDTWLLEQMAVHSIPADQLTLEITESAAATSLDALQRFIERLTRAGVKFAVDDFGTGVNSLSHLKTLNVSTIKLDGSYVRDVATDPRSQALVRAIVQLADTMGILTIAEFVDSVALRTRLAEIGVQFAQGYAVGRAEPLANLLEPHAAAHAVSLASSA